MQLISQEIAIHAFTPYDGSLSTAIKVVHRTSRQEAMNDETPSQIENLRRAMLELLNLMNPNPDHIKVPKLMIYDVVRVRLPDSFQDGRIDKLAWDFKRRDWKYYVECKLRVVSAWYERADLEIIGID